MNITINHLRLRRGVYDVCITEWCWMYTDKFNFKHEILFERYIIKYNCKIYT